MKVKLNQDVSKSCPGTHRPIKFVTGQIIYMDINMSNIPGLPVPHGSLGWMEAKKKQGTDTPIFEKWLFWSNSDIDIAIILEAEYIDTLYLTPQERVVIPDNAVDNAPFTVVVE